MAINPTAQMMNPMASILGPDATQQQYQIQQNQRYADMLMQQAMEQPQGQMVSGHYVAPSPVQGLANMLKAYVGRKTSDEIPKQQVELSNAQNAQIAKLFGMGGEVAPQQAAGMALGGGAMQGDVGPTMGNADRMQGVQTGTGSAMPLIGGDRRASMLAFQLGGPAAYGKALADQAMPTGSMKEISAVAPMGSPENQRLMQALAQKNTYIAPTVVSEGGALMPAGASQPSYIAPKGGIAMQNTPQGFQAAPVPGYAPATASIEQAQAYGKGLGGAQTTPAERLDVNTGQTVATTQAANMGLPQQGMPQQGVAPAQPVVTKASPIAQKAGEELNSNWIKTELEPAQLLGNSAQKSMDSIRVLRSTNIDTGFGADAKAAAANVLTSLGVKDAEKYATNAQVFKTEIAKKLMDTMAAQKGAQSQADFENIRQTEASLKNTPQANNFIFDLAEAKAMQDQRKAAYFTKASEIPALRNNLPAITNEWRKIEGSIFDFPSMSKYKAK